MVLKLLVLLAVAVVWFYKLWAYKFGVEAPWRAAAITFVAACVALGVVKMPKIDVSLTFKAITTAAYEALTGPFVELVQESGGPELELTVSKSGLRSVLDGPLGQATDGRGPLRQLQFKVSNPTSFDIADLRCKLQLPYLAVRATVWKSEKTFGIATESDVKLTVHGDVQSTCNRKPLDNHAGFTIERLDSGGTCEIDVTIARLIVDTRPPDQPLADVGHIKCDYSRLVGGNRTPLQAFWRLIPSEDYTVLLGERIDRFPEDIPNFWIMDP